MSRGGQKNKSSFWAYKSSPDFDAIMDPKSMSAFLSAFGQKSAILVNAWQFGNAVDKVRFVVGKIILLSV